MKAAGWLRRFRGWCYRRYPQAHPKYRAGYERRWNLEEAGFTQEGFWKHCRQKFFQNHAPGRLLELSAGDGLIGSLGIWMEQERPDWELEIWEHRAGPLRNLLRNRPGSSLHEGRWRAETARGMGPVEGVTSRGSRESSALCRAIGAGWIRPRIVGLWNPSQRPVWMKRMGRLGYHLEFIHQRMEFYRDRHGNRKTQDH